MHIVLACRTNHTFLSCCPHSSLTCTALLCNLVCLGFQPETMYYDKFFCGYLLQADIGVKFQPSVASALHNQGLLCVCLITWKTGGDNGFWLLLAQFDPGLNS